MRYKNVSELRDEGATLLGVVEKAFQVLEMFSEDPAFTTYWASLTPAKRDARFTNLVDTLRLHE
jgi:hypothetical protein